VNGKETEKGRRRSNVGKMARGYAGGGSKAGLMCLLFAIEGWIGWSVGGIITCHLYGAKKQEV